MYQIQVFLIIMLGDFYSKETVRMFLDDARKAEETLERKEPT
jgi:predicted ATPase